MKCISSPALENIEIARYVDGEADEAVMAHLQECPYCSDRARQWTLLQSRLREQLYRTTCPTPMELGDHHLGLLPAPQALVVGRHMRECPLCKREVAELQEFLAESDAEPGLLDTAGVLIAQLIGGGAAPALGALRGESKGPLTFEAQGMVIVLDIQPTREGKVEILGQVAASDQEQWTEAMVELRQVDLPPRTASLDDLGSFHFDEALLGPTELTFISSNNTVVQIPKIDIAV